MYSVDQSLYPGDIQKKTLKAWEIIYVVINNLTEIIQNTADQLIEIIKRIMQKFKWNRFKYYIVQNALERIVDIQVRIPSLDLE